uniref:uncharacterized protein LOC122595385 n=1 Tax=Erigeron canadensis TaxID=72917 RepID=UPI001CB9B251|nr:uncharacterized protein LOC122595385 [Erigeron canadensis]
MEINPSPSNDPNPPNHPAVDLLGVNDDHKADSVVNEGLNKLQLDNHSDSDEEEFTFMCVVNDDGNDESVTTESDKSGNTRPVFPLFDQSLLLSNEYGDRDSRLTSQLPVNKVFIETPSTPSSSSSSSTSSTICSSISKEEPAEINIKSNSTGFSKLWRFRNEMNRSNSDGRDAYVYLQNPNNNNNKGKMSLLNDVVGGSSEKVLKKKQNDVVEEEGEGKGKKAVAVKKGVKVKKSTGSSAHEVYLKQKGERTEEERRRSYLPYRPGLMGFFTNVNGGLSKNVHPF